MIHASVHLTADATFRTGGTTSGDGGYLSIDDGSGFATAVIFVESAGQAEEIARCLQVLASMIKDGAPIGGEEA